MRPKTKSSVHFPLKSPKTIPFIAVCTNCGNIKIKNRSATIKEMRSDFVHAPGLPVRKQQRGQTGGGCRGNQAGPVRPGQRLSVCLSRAGERPTGALPRVEAAHTPGRRPHRRLLPLPGYQRCGLLVC